MDGMLCSTCVYHIHNTAEWMPSNLSTTVIENFFVCDEPVAKAEKK
jgi:hypothetical protein